MMKSATFQIAEEETTPYDNVAQFYISFAFLGASVAGMQSYWCG